MSFNSSKPVVEIVGGPVYPLHLYAVLFRRIFESGHM